MVYFSLARETDYAVGDNITIASKLTVNNVEGMRMNYIDLEIINDDDEANTNTVRMICYMYVYGYIRPAKQSEMQSKLFL